jgi:hypothetical protein
LPIRLAAAGVGWVLVEHGTPGSVPDLSGLRLVRAGPDLTLYRVPGPIRPSDLSVGRVVIVVIGDAMALAVLAGTGASVLLRRRRKLVRYREMA